jgi:hypothetical protein
LSLDLAVDDIYEIVRAQGKLLRPTIKGCLSVLYVGGISPFDSFAESLDINLHRRVGLTIIRRDVISILLYGYLGFEFRLRSSAAQERIELPTFLAWSAFYQRLQALGTGRSLGESRLIVGQHNRSHKNRACAGEDLNATQRWRESSQEFWPVLRF